MARVVSFKKPLSLDEQIDYIKEYKKIVVTDRNNINRDIAKNFLYEHNYINVISPFKYYFCVKNPNGKPIKYNNRHQYTEEVDFSIYMEKYENERALYPVLYKNIIKIESVFNSILSFEVMHKYNIIDYKHFDSFIADLKFNLEKERNNNQLINNHFRYIRILESINNFMPQLEEYNNIYVFFDRLSISDLLNVFICLDEIVKKKIFQELKIRNLTLGIPDILTFEDSFFRVVAIRNCICHGNSLEILMRYYDIKNTDLRRKTDIEKYKTVINKLSII